VSRSLGICWHAIMRCPAGGAEELSNYTKCRRLVDCNDRQLYGRSVCGWKIQSCVILINTSVQTSELFCLCFSAINPYSSTDSMPKEFPEPAGLLHCLQQLFSLQYTWKNSLLWPTQFVTLRFPHNWTAGLQTHFLSKRCVHKQKNLYRSVKTWHAYLSVC
jgi:hypothetical protein